MKKVVGVESRLRAGTSIWDCRLECGCVVAVIRRSYGSRVDKRKAPPVRMKCRKCEAT